jgi:hypothetical protein
MINDALDPFWRGTKENALPPITHYNNKVFAKRRKIISNVLEIVENHWVDLHRNLPTIHVSNTDAHQLGYWRTLSTYEQTVITTLPIKHWLNKPRTNILEVISNDNPWPALKQLNTVRKLKISVVPEHILKSHQRDPRIYLKKNLLPLPQEETAKHKDISTHHPSPPIGIIKALPRPTTGRVLQIITMDSPPPPKRVLAIITLD